ncbi:hypothetical protein [Sediminibacter sp. Hel_I_10]|uniref:hypothetical protein n=1 Tax=Sediminibacter sp. Hel_I_10 TaxID=1392490 RepID=UPI00047B62D5|nr:hypothetical protein [Sediminibacter sp. Hel_I_10]
MIQINIITKNVLQAQEITSLLYQEKLVLNEYILKEVVGRLPNDAGELSNVDEVLIVGTTKALLFKTIVELLKEKYGDKIPIIYAVPIVYMEETQTETLRSGTAKV